MFKRLLVYLKEMFPFLTFLGTMISGITIQIVYLRLSGEPAIFDPIILLPSLVITAVSLLIRIMDEFKDFEDDKINFSHRPLPSGRVLKSDLKLLGFFCVFLVLILSLRGPKTFYFSLLTLSYTYLMLKWFFLENIIRKSLPLSLLTHHPIVFLNTTYLVVAQLELRPSLGWWPYALILPISFVFTNWEVARKIRAPKDETSYTTYSKIWGPKVATLACLFFQLVVSFSVLSIFSYLHTSWILKVVFLCLMAFTSWPFINFLMKYKLNRPLKVEAENQILVILGMLLVGAFI